VFELGEPIGLNGELLTGRRLVATDGGGGCIGCIGCVGGIRSIRRIGGRRSIRCIGGRWCGVVVIATGADDSDDRDEAEGQRLCVTSCVLSPWCVDWNALVVWWLGGTASGPVTSGVVPVPDGSVGDRSRSTRNITTPNIDGEDRAGMNISGRSDCTLLLDPDEEADALLDHWVKKKSATTIAPITAPPDAMRTPVMIAGTAPGSSSFQQPGPADSPC
jgi:hypothetical protein